ncbi:MAG: nuclease, partial [Betaproteobacteria bacterium]|nr:nuclease [Betaproteobacteria bacterium]
QVGDHNRTYTVELACVAVPAGGDEAAAAWLRQALPRRTKVNLRPVGNDGGTLVARVQRLGQADAGSSADLGSGLVAAGLANAKPDC